MTGQKIQPVQKIKAVNNAQLFAKLCEVENLLKSRQLSENSCELWTVQNVADYFQCSYEHAHRAICADPRFPAAVDIVGRTGNKSKNLYVAGDVVKFCLKYKKRKVRL